MWCCTIMEHDCDAGFCQTNPWETENTVLTAHTASKCAGGKPGASQKQKEKFWPKCSQKIPRLEMQGPTLTLVSQTEIGHLPTLKVTLVAKAGCWAQTSPLPPLPLLLLNLQSNPGRLHSFLLREARLYCMSSLLIEILDIISPENLEILQLNGKNTLDHRSQTDGDTLHASNINKILILR